MSLDNVNKLNQLLQGGQNGKLYFSSWLRTNGYSDQLLKFLLPFQRYSIPEWQ